MSSADGNYRKGLFINENTGAAFERTLMETVERCGWKWHAYRWALPRGLFRHVGTAQ